MVFTIIFTDTETFLAQVEQGGFIEYAEVFGNYYGTSQAKVKEQLQQGHDVLLKLTGRVLNKFVDFFLNQNKFYPPSNSI